MGDFGDVVVGLVGAGLLAVLFCSCGIFQVVATQQRYLTTAAHSSGIVLHWFV